ncbi:MAG: hypothetical protein IKC74_03330, partial [Clostridia bacterium]|nr:hypothetical protein [Clostridia bacterium]
QNEEWYGIGIPNTEYYNSIDLENGKGDIKAKKIVLNGTENFLISKLTDYHYFYVPIGDVGVKPNTDLLCDQYDSTNESTRDKTCFVGSGGVAIRDDRFTTANDFKTYLAEQYANGTPVTLICAMATPTTEDIDITDDNLIGVEGGGTVTLVNEYGYDIPCDIDFFTGDNKIVGSRVFVGDLMGRASFAKYFDVDGSPSEKTIAEALEDVTREGSPIKVTSTSIGQKATEGLELTVSTDVLANPPAEIGDIVIDAYTDAENLSYINLWEITGFDAGYSTMRIVGINSVNTGGGSASFAQKAEADGNGNNIAGTYATKQALKALEDSANDSIHNIEAAIDGVEANGQALADKFDSLGAVNGVVAKAVTATNAESAKAGSGLDISIRDASVNASDALTKATNALASAAENHTIIQNFPNTYAKISDLSNYSLLTESGNSVSVSWEPPINGVNPYKLNIKLINAKGNEISSAQIDFPLEQMVVGAEYTESTKELVLETLEGTVKVPVSDIFRGLITESNIGNQTVAKASLATKATNDGQGNDIVQTYATNSNLSALENRVDNLDSDGQALAERLDSLSIVNGVVAKAVTATNAESAKAGSGLDNDITQARKDASDSLAKANSVLSLVNENKTQLEAIFNEDAPATVQKAKYAETAGSADYASRCRDSNGNPLLISNIVTKADAAELLASQANLASKNAIVSARCEYIKSSYQASVGTLNLYLKTADNREIAVTDFQEALMSLLEDFMS